MAGQLLDQPAARIISTDIETWPIAGSFTISRGSKSEAHVVVVEVGDGTHRGCGECVPYPRYGQTPADTLAELQGLCGADLDLARLQRDMAPSAARNALDCALWDLAAKRTRRRAFEIAGLAPPVAVQTCYTLSLAAPAQMAAKAAEVAHLGLLKLKLGAAGDPASDAERMRAVRRARPDARLVADANEGWASGDIERLLGVAAEVGIEVVEQPLPAGADHALRHIAKPVRICADESAHASDSLAGLVGRYDAVNIKLDKTGGLTEALAMAAEARRLGLAVMVGSMVATSLSMAPALLVAQHAEWADLDGPLLLARDRQPGLVIRDGLIDPAPPRLWG